MIAWSEFFEIGHSVVDKQHKGLVDKVNQLHDLSIECSKGEDVYEQLNHVFNDLATYTVEHFSTEEELFKGKYENSFSEKVHLAQHKEFVSKFLELKDEIMITEDVDSEKLKTFVVFLIDWLSNHILNTDKEMMRQISA